MKHARSDYDDPEGCEQCANGDGTLCHVHAAYLSGWADALRYVKHAADNLGDLIPHMPPMEQVAEATQGGLAAQARLRSVLSAALPRNMGGYPDLFWPSGFDGDDPWGDWERAAEKALLEEGETG